MDRGARRATVHGVAKSQTRLCKEQEADCASQAHMGKGVRMEAAEEGAGPAVNREQGGNLPRPPGCQPPGHTDGHSPVRAMSLNPKCSSLCTAPPSSLQDGGRQPAAGEMEAGSLRLEGWRRAESSLLVCVPPSWRSPQGSTSATRALWPHRPPPIQPSAGLLISHPVPPASFLPFLGRAQAWHHSKTA